MLVWLLIINIYLLLIYFLFIYLYMSFVANLITSFLTLIIGCL